MAKRSQPMCVALTRTGIRPMVPLWGNLVLSKLRDTLPFRSAKNTGRLGADGPVEQFTVSRDAGYRKRSPQLLRLCFKIQLFG
jgi:hypothetical protein